MGKPFFTANQYGEHGSLSGSLEFLLDWEQCLFNMTFAQKESFS